MKLRAAKSATKYTSLLFVSLAGLLTLSLSGNLLAWLRLDDLLNNRQETYIPMFFDTPFTLSRSHADANYLESIAQSMVFLRYTVSPESIHANHQSLLRYVQKEARPEMQDVLAVEAKEVIQNNVTSVFFLSKMEVYPVEGIVDIHGELKTWIGKREALPEPKNVRLHVKYANGISEVISFEDIIDEDKK
ncbi:type IV conjugative transfer system protein TraE [Providencia alcalifaciens]|uniref:type IV conjugative transfer system protein TraE n=1 Tax=Providencia alcalifaciens TaxID=126385 RepID=UPI001CC3D16B|nr:type IV conjugative transfer system protein TraE [Providencia alcalifaciens]CAG9435622.1 hypothetical protein NVI2019_OGMBKCAO_03934 [Providencia alcalifaciens]CAG9436049.1 hypothetical protein NVI2019_PLFLNFOB_03995 [Providencia alcalifaciens]CAG9436062.1 hypothetical protein NVI2019_ANGEOOBF_03996 [Providencia alcalifaciens]CAG9436077.1 hypothetical protein NVI2019_KOLGMIGM_03997 [Providencia alcalifaciens]CAG9437381.1 hypothetical protein NVI2019_OHEONHNH_03995 [Providencia alcalifaciens